MFISMTDVMSQNESLQEFKFNYLQKLANATAALVMVPNFLAFIFLFSIDTGNPKAIADFARMVNIALLLIGIIILLWSVIWHWADLKNRKTAHPFANKKWWDIGFDICRYLLTAIILLYA